MYADAFGVFSFHSTAKGHLTSLSALTASTTDRYAPIQKSEPPTTAQASKGGVRECFFTCDLSASPAILQSCKLGDVATPYGQSSHTRATCSDACHQVVKIRVSSRQEQEPPIQHPGYRPAALSKCAG